MTRLKSIFSSMRWTEIFLLILYGVMTFLMVLRHEPWRDEAQSWLLVSQVPFDQFFLHQIRYEQHPFLWYLLL